MSYGIENHAGQLAAMLDNGQGAQVAEILRAEVANMSQQEIRLLVSETNRFEQKGWGDDLRIARVGGYNGLPADTISIQINRQDEWGRPVCYRVPIAVVDEYMPSRQYQYSQLSYDRAPYQDYSYQRPAYQDYSYQQYPYQQFQPYQSRYGGYRPEDMIIPTVVGLGLGLLFNHGRHNGYYGNNFGQNNFYSQIFNRAPNYYHRQNYGYGYGRYA